jgi:hypothetical protein
MIRSCSPKTSQFQIQTGDNFRNAKNFLALTRLQALSGLPALILIESKLCDPVIVEPHPPVWLRVQVPHHAHPHCTVRVRLVE